MRLDALLRFFANRYDLKGDEFSRALNQIFVVFNADPKVMDALSAFHQEVVTRQDAEDALLKLSKAMCKSCDVDFAAFNDAFFLKPFNTRP